MSIAVTAVAKPAARPAAARLTRAQLGWIAVFLLVAQAPQWLRLPLWMSALGTVLILVRFAMPEARRLPRWILPLLAACAGVGIRIQFGYFIARDPCVAFLYVLVGIKFLESRKLREGTLLVCLGLFLAMTQFFYTQSIFAALVLVPVLLALGGALTALRSSPLRGDDRIAPLRLTARMVVQGIPIAALLFLLFPRLAGPLWGLPADAAARTGLSDRMAPGSISDLSLSDAMAFRVDFQGPVPPSRERYWRGPVLTQFDGREWSARPPIPLSPARMRVPGRTVTYAVTLEPSNKPWLFALDIPSTLPRLADDSGPAPATGGELGWITRDRQLLARTPLLQAVRYEQSSVMRSAFTALPGDGEDNLYVAANNRRTKAYAQELRASVPTDGAYVNALLSWFREENFVYTLSPPLLENDPVDAFLFDTRRGFCEHFAGGFVLMLREARIPARVVTGYQGGEINPNGNYLMVRQSDAHAWAEALIAGEWHRFDPTAAVAPSRIENGIGAALPQGEPVPYLARVDLTWLKNLRLHWDAVNYQWQRSVIGFNTLRQRDLWHDLGLDSSRPWQPASLLAFGIGIWVFVLYLVVKSRQSNRDPVLELWHRACRRFARAGLARHRSEGPLDYGRRAALRWPQAAEAIAQLTTSYALLRYGGVPAQRSRLLSELKQALGRLPPARSLRRA